MPTIASTFRGYRTVIRHDVDGLLVPPGDYEQLAWALCYLLMRPPERARLGTQGRARAELYTWQRVTTRIEAYYADDWLCAPRCRARRTMSGRSRGRAPRPNRSPAVWLVTTWASDSGAGVRGAWVRGREATPGRASGGTAGGSAGGSGSRWEGARGVW